MSEENKIKHDKLEIELRYIVLAGCIFLVVGLFLILAILLSILIGVEVSKLDLLLLRGVGIYLSLGSKILLVSILLKLFKIKSISFNKINTSRGKDNSMLYNFNKMIKSYFPSKEKEKEQ